MSGVAGRVDGQRREIKVSACSARTVVLRDATDIVVSHCDSVVTSESILVYACAHDVCM